VYEKLTNAQIYIIIARKIFFSELGGGHVPPLPPSPVSYAYADPVYYGGQLDNDH